MKLSARNQLKGKIGEQTWQPNVLYALAEGPGLEPERLHYMTRPHLGPAGIALGSDTPSGFAAPRTSPGDNKLIEPPPRGGGERGQSDRDYRWRAGDCPRIDQRHWSSIRRWVSG